MLFIPDHSPFLSVLRRIVARPSGAIGLTLTLAHLAMALTAPVLTPYDPTFQNVDAIQAAPSFSHIFGTDSLGRDVLARVLYGGRLALVVTGNGGGKLDHGSGGMGPLRVA